MVIFDIYFISIFSYYMYYIINIIILYLFYWDENLFGKVMFKYRGVDGG